MSGTWSIAYRRHGGAIRAYLQRRLSSREEAEDLCQETFLRVMRSESAPEEPARLRAYLFSTARNLLVNHLQRRGLVRVESQLGEAVRLEELAPDSGDDATDRERGLALARDLGRELERLPAEQRRAFILGALERWPYAEIAARTGWSLSKVKINVYRARKTLIRRLAAHEPWPAADAESDEKEASA